MAHERDVDSREAANDSYRLYQLDVESLNKMLYELLEDIGVELTPEEKSEKKELKLTERERQKELDELRKRASDPNMADANGNTPLHMAVLRHDGSETSSMLLQALIAGGANMGISNRAGVSPEDLARSRGFDLGSVPGTA